MISERWYNSSEGITGYNSAEIVGKVGTVNGDENAKQLHGR